MTKVVEQKLFVDAKQKKVKLKKNALEPVDKNLEAKIDPKFKTELCKSWVETKFCVYGNKCRFAHGRDEIFNKQVNKSKYKLKACSSFFQNSYCNYGSRCHFKHDERKLSEIHLPYYSLQLLSNKYLNNNKCNNNSEDDCQRLKVFREILTTSPQSKTPNENLFINNSCNGCCNGIIKSNLDNNQVNKSNEIEFHTRILTNFY